VAEKLLVLGGDHGLEDVARHVAERDDDPYGAIAPAGAAGFVVALAHERRLVGNPDRERADLGP
jgi:hypothetical protein